ncbi:MAG: TIGR03118 family protein, partial [Rhodospirillales bacterium]|nr:TIGR03118 family protein [Acetobacter sp.]
MKISSKLALLFSGAVILAPAASAQTRDGGCLQTNLVANKAEYHPQIVDEKMINAWGIALRPPGAGGHIWVTNAGNGSSSEY